jgi:hypothetical protein
MTKQTKTKRTQKGRFARGASGNPSGRPRGSRNRATLLMESLLEEESEMLTRKAIDLAKEGDVYALRLCLERLLPPRKERSIEIDLPAVEKMNEISAAVSTVLTAIGTGQITPAEGETVANILSIQNRIVENVDLETRLEHLEQTVFKAPDEPSPSAPADRSDKQSDSSTDTHPADTE